MWAEENLSKGDSLPDEWQKIEKTIKEKTNSIK
jgi:hypothetical protein